MPEPEREGCAELYLVRFEGGSYAKAWQGEPNAWEDYWYVAMLDGHDGDWLEEEYEPVAEDYVARVEEETAEATLERVFCSLNIPPA